MDFDRLRAFVWSLEEGGISAAARRLCRTQPAVTRMLQTLEEQIGTELIDRRARPLRPTTTGLRVLEYARQILQAADRLTEAGLHATKSRQLLRLGVSRSLMWHLRDRRFANPVAPLSDTAFNVRSGWSPRLYRRFVRGEFDGAVLLMPDEWTPDVPCRGEVVRHEPLVIVAPRPPGAPAKASIGIDALRDRAWILNPDGCGFRHSLTRSLAGIGHRLHVQFELDASPQEHLWMVVSGVGCSIVPASALKQDLKNIDRIQQLSVAEFKYQLAVWMVWNENCRPMQGTEAALAAIFTEPNRLRVVDNSERRHRVINRPPLRGGGSRHA
jgi:DNA-binding transcriptional LysR family regulator